MRRNRRILFYLVTLVLLQHVCSGQSQSNGTILPKLQHRYINLEPMWDTSKVCHNPHKGWYIHYFDNGIKRYGNKLSPNDYLKDFPGLNDIYLRLAWSYLEPQEGKFNWQVIDKEIERWTKQGYKISFRISCKETGDVVYATPEWVQKAGAKGTMINDNAWEPDYGDPIFLKKLENFHKAFAERYADKAWLEYVDIGSYGDWGEGHTAFSNRKDWPVEVIKKHIDIHTKYYQKTTLVISDDVVGSRESIDGSREEILHYILNKGITLRDDGVSVKWFADRFGESTLRNPEFFELFWRNKPINLELEHYDATVDQNTWKNGVPFERAIEEAHATYIGFHGYPREWLTQHQNLAARLANKVGYWYFIRSAVIPNYYERGKNGYINLVFTNKGVAPAYHHYPLVIKLKHTTSDKAYLFELTKADNRKWMPGSFIGEAHSITLQSEMPTGEYEIAVGLYEKDSDINRFIELPFKKDLKTADGLYTIGKVDVK